MEKYLKLYNVNTEFIHKNYMNFCLKTIDISNNDLFIFDSNDYPKNNHLKKKKILILEDEILVWLPIAQLAEKYNIWWDLLTSNITPINFDISIYNYILIDRDNELSLTDYVDFHTFLLKQSSLDKILHKIVPISWSEINNIYIRNKIINNYMQYESKAYQKFDAKTILKLQLDYEWIINSKIFTKSMPQFLNKIENLFISL